MPHHCSDEGLRMGNWDGSVDINYNRRLSKHPIQCPIQCIHIYILCTHESLALSDVFSYRQRWAGGVLGNRISFKNVCVLLWAGVNGLYSALQLYLYILLLRWSITTTSLGINSHFTCSPRSSTPLVGQHCAEGYGRPVGQAS